MPSEKPAPISPEGKRAAERMRLIFYSIAAANIVLVAIVMWQRNAHKEPATDPAKSAATEDPANKTSEPRQQDHSERSGGAK